ncbi:MAG TPA: hypothetical protein DCP91_06105 [Eggerthellaceae bacterium]|nr:hypothetical protein [Eggerthellaceae bacterium]
MVLRDKDGLTENEFLAQYRQKDYPRPSFTADVVAVSGAAGAQESFNRCGSCDLQVLLVQRGGHPYLGCWAFPGGFVNPGEDADTAAARELEEETGVTGLAFQQLGVYSAPGRDPRGWTVSAAYLARMDEPVAARAGDDAAVARWCDLHVAREAGGSATATICAEGDVLSCTFAENDGSCCADRAKLVSADGLAFDHANMLADALARLLME